MLSERGGFFCALAYIFTIALSTVFVEKLGLHVNVAVLNFSVAVIACSVFNLSNLARIKTAYLAILKQPVLWAAMSLSIAGAWVLSYYATVSSSADFSMAMVFLSCSAVGGLFDGKRLKSLVCVFSIALCILAKHPSLFAITTGILSGVSLYFYTWYSKRYAKANASKPLDVLAVRFFPMLLITGGLLAHAHLATTVSITAFSWHIWLLIVLVGFANRILPMLFLQPAVQAMRVERLSFLLTFVPLTTYIFESMVNMHFPLELFIAVSISTLALNIDRIWQHMVVLRNSHS